VQIQSRRHAYIASLLRVRHALVAVNKMDLIGYDEPTFRAIESDLRPSLSRLPPTPERLSRCTLSRQCFEGDNVVHATDAMPWYAGPSLLELLEALPSAQETSSAPFRFPVQRVLRPDHTSADSRDRLPREQFIEATRLLSFLRDEARRSSAL